mgnify:CR=1 FL=1
MSELQTMLKDAQGPAGRKLLLFALAAAAIVTVWIVAHQMTTPTYMTLFRDLELKGFSTTVPAYPVRSIAGGSAA